MISYLWAGNGKMWRFHAISFPSNHSHSRETSLAIPTTMGITWDPMKPRSLRIGPELNLPVLSPFTTLNGSLPNPIQSNEIWRRRCSLFARISNDNILHTDW